MRDRVEITVRYPDVDVEDAPALEEGTGIWKRRLHAGSEEPFRAAPGCRHADPRSLLSKAAVRKKFPLLHIAFTLRTAAMVDHRAQRLARAFNSASRSSGSPTMADWMKRISSASVPAMR